MRDEKEILQALADSLVKLDPKKAKATAEEAIKAGIPAFRAIDEGLANGMKVVSQKWDCEEYFLPELLLAADAMNAAIEVLKPHLKAEKAAVRGKVVLGTIQGDIHDIGKSIVNSMLLAAGFDVYDLGVDVPPKKFIEKIKEVDADLVGSSAFMTSTIRYQKDLEVALRGAGIRQKVVTMIGGVATSSRYAEEIGADGWAKNAAETVKTAKQLLARRKK